ncbi:MAG: RNA 2',3'-cyclic phosphodiesterase [Candidatus Thermoplasmatota archaeon]|nr:RNA 2',3'-cyclic phosphodiesterase [Candidatus Thermoplasmatota archaeon]
MKFRAFIAVDIEPSEDLKAVVRELAQSRADLKIVKPQQLHVTLKFLGDTDDSLVEEIRSRMRSSAAGIQPFTMRLVGMGAFPSLSNIRVVWVGIEDGKLLKTVADELDKSLRTLGFERDRKGFVPHLTLARTRSPRNLANVQEIIRGNAATDYGEYPVERVLLKKSVLSPQGPAYSIVCEHSLRSD